MADQLQIYNDCMLYLGQRRIASLTENSDQRRALDDAFLSVFNYCLEQGLWRFMVRTVQMDASTTIVPTFGYLFAFAIPVDWVRTVQLSVSQTMDPLLQYSEENGYWFGNFTPMFAQYVSNDALYGSNLGEWPASFADYVACRLAARAGPRILGAKMFAQLDRGAEGLSNKEKKARRVAKANDAMNEGPEFPPVSTWIRSRRGFGTRMPQAGDNPGGTLMT